MSRGRCKFCYETVELEHDRTFGKLVLTVHVKPWSGDPCEGSGFPHYHPVADSTATGRKLPGVGKVGVAPCGHQGEHVTATMIVCPLGCPAKPVAAPSLYACRHAIKITFAGTTSCKQCGKVFARP